MKKYLFIAMTGLFTLFSLNSCLEDEGNYDYIDMGGFQVDTVGIKTRHTVKQFGLFELTPKLEYAGDKSKLKYKWELYKSELTSIGNSAYGTGFTHNYTRDDYPDYTLAETEKLSVRITAVPGEYYLVFTALDPETNVKAMMDYRLTVEGVVGTGLAVLYKGAAGIDIDVVASPLFNGSLTVPAFNRKAYSIANASRPFAGDPRELVVAVSTSDYHIYLTSTEDAVRLSSLDMSVEHEFDEIFAGKAPRVKDVNNIVVNGSNHFLINDGVAYKSARGISVAPLAMTEDHYQAVGVKWAYGINSVWYDGLKRRFLHSLMWGAEITPIVNTAGAFDFGNVGKDLIYWSKGYYEGNNYANYCFFKNPQDDGSRYLYVFLADKASGNEYTAVGAMDVTACPGLPDACSFATGERGPVVFYATETAVYHMTYNVDEGTSGAEKVWPDTPLNAQEKITRIELFKNAGLNLDNNALDKYLLVATYDETSGKGKIHVIESDISSGVLGGEVAVYEFDGKIADFDFIAN